MNSGASPRKAGRKSHRRLVSRSHPARTFRSLATFVALLFLSAGIYLIAAPLINPVTEHDIGVIAGAFAIALASILLFYLVRPAAGHFEVLVESQQEPATLVQEEPVAPKQRGLGTITLPQAGIHPAGGLRD